jgi:2-dehydro-3-deoxyphosphogluconate aldolase/(4S)-4-hydroxy-2-oxoglutarate aldolase
MLDADVARLCNRRKVAYLPGCQTVNEITAAHDLGVEIVKLFPGAQAGGPAFIKNVRGPLPYVRILPTGGVEPTEANLRGWFEAGAAAVGMGSNLIRSDWVAAGDYAAIRSAAAQSLEWIRTFRTRDPLD